MTVSLVVIAAVALAAALAYTRAVMMPFVLAVFLSFLVSPLVDVLKERLRIPRFVSVILTLLFALGLLTLIALLITASA